MSENTLKNWCYADCRACKWLHHITAADGFAFGGCGHEPYKGKMVSELECCPCTEEEYKSRRVRA